MSPSSQPQPGSAVSVSTKKLDIESDSCFLRIDGVGTFLLCFDQRVTIGNYDPTRAEPANVALLAKLSQQHATVIRNDDGYVLEVHAPTKVNGRDVLATTVLNDGYEIELGGNVKLSFHLPTALSLSARFEFKSNHRPALAVDGIVLMDETCLLGPGSENHICCEEWPGSVLLYRNNKGQLWCKSRMEIFTDNRHVSSGTALSAGDIINGPGLRFRIDKI